MLSFCSWIYVRKLWAVWLSCCLCVLHDSKEHHWQHSSSAFWLISSMGGKRLQEQILSSGVLRRYCLIMIICLCMVNIDNFEIQILQLVPPFSISRVGIYVWKLFIRNRSEDDEKRPARSRRGKSKRANLKEESSSESEKERSSRDRRKTKDSEKEKESEEDVDEDETPPSSDEDVSLFLKYMVTRLFWRRILQNCYKTGRGILAICI